MFAPVRAFSHRPLTEGKTEVPRGERTLLALQSWGAEEPGPDLLCWSSCSLRWVAAPVAPSPCCFPGGGWAPGEARIGLNILKNDLMFPLLSISLPFCLSIIMTLFAGVCRPANLLSQAKGGGCYYVVGKWWGVLYATDLASQESQQPSRKLEN